MLVQLQRNWVVDGTPPQTVSKADQSFISLDNIRAILRRRFVLIGTCMALLLAVGLLFILTTKPMYGSTATLYLDIQNAQMVQGDGTVTSVAPLGLDDVNVNSQTVIIESEKIAIKVIKDLGL